MDAAAAGALRKDQQKGRHQAQVPME